MNEPLWYRTLKGIATGTTGGIIVTIVGQPFDTLKVRLQSQSQINPVYKGLTDCFMKTIKWEGIRGLFKGLGSPLAGQVLFRTALFGTFYESLYRYSNGRYMTERVDIKKYYAAGATTGFIASLIEGPIDLIKSKIQVQIVREKANIPYSVKYNGVFHCGSHIIKTYGTRGLFQGLTPTIMRDTLGYCLYFGTFEYFKLMLSDRNPERKITRPELMFWGGTSGMIFWAAVYNIDVVKSAMMADDSDFKKRKFKNTLDCIQKLYTLEGGYSRFWKGFVPCALRAYPANAMMLTIVDITRDIFPIYESKST